MPSTPDFRMTHPYKVINEPLATLLQTQPKLLAAAPAMYELLKRIQWSAGEASYGWHTSGSGRCPICGYSRPHPEISGVSHGPDCELAAILKAAGGE